MDEVKLTAEVPPGAWRGAQRRRAARTRQQGGCRKTHIAARCVAGSEGLSPQAAPAKSRSGRAEARENEFCPVLRPPQGLDRSERGGPSAFRGTAGRSCLPRACRSRPREILEGL